MFEIIRVGIPLRSSDITTAFINVVDDITLSNDCIAVSTVDYSADPTMDPDYKSAPAGHKFLFNNLYFKQFDNELKFNVVNTMGYIWTMKNPQGQFRDGDFLSLHLLELFERLYQQTPFKRVYMFTPGSPHIMDAFTNSMPKFHPVSVIDTYSSITIIGKAMQKHVNQPYKLRHYNMDFIHGPLNKTIMPGYINLFGGISKGYDYNQRTPLVLHFFQELRKILKDTDWFMYSTIKNDDVSLTVIPFKQALEQQDYFLHTDDIITYGVTHNNDI